MLRQNVAGRNIFTATRQTTNYDTRERGEGVFDEAKGENKTLGIHQQTRNRRQQQYPSSKTLLQKGESNRWIVCDGVSGIIETSGGLNGLDSE